MSEAAASWIKALWPVVVAVVVGVSAVMVTQQQVKANAEAIHALESRKADSELVNTKLLYIQQSVDEIKRILNNRSTR